MKTIPVTALRIDDAKALDPITLFIEDWSPGRGSLTVVCYGRIWGFNACWGAMGDDMLRFIDRCDEGYLCNKLTLWEADLTAKARKSEAAYLQRIVAAIKVAVRAHLSVATS